jgi:hypothetical protein
VRIVRIFPLTTPHPIFLGRQVLMLSCHDMIMSSCSQNLTPHNKLRNPHDPHDPHRLEGPDGARAPGCSRHSRLQWYPVTINHQTGQTITR